MLLKEHQAWKDAAGYRTEGESEMPTLLNFIYKPSSYLKLQFIFPQDPGSYSPILLEVQRNKEDRITMKIQARNPSTAIPHVNQ